MAGTVESTISVKPADGRPTLPAGSVATAVRVCEVSLNAGEGVNVHVPPAGTVTVPIGVAPPLS